MSQEAPVGQGEILGVQKVDHFRGIAIVGRPGAPEFGLMGAGSPQQAVSRLQAFVGYQKQPVIGALCLTASAETITPGPTRSFIDQLADGVVSDYYEAAERGEIWLLLQVQHESGGALQAAKEWEKWLLKPRIGIYFDLNPNGDKDIADLDEAIDFVNALTGTHQIPPKPILATGYTRPPSGVHSPEIRELNQVGDIYRDAQESGWVLLV
jgi:hypothetical protein